jgi:hypothetical protein
MKKAIVLFSLILFAVVSMAQTPGSFVSFLPDTTTNAETEYLVLDSPNQLTKNYVVTAFVIPTNESGTATVTAMPQGSDDNSVWFDLESSATTINTAGTVANASFEYADANWKYYRIKLVSTGTGVTSNTGKLGLKRK